ncbi:hypothetical protein Tco_1407425 [Tanacetum coccineum]
MSQPAEQAQTPANSAVCNTAGKGSKQVTDENPEYLPTDRLREICDKHYDQILPLMAEKVHQEKLQEDGGPKRREEQAPSHLSGILASLRDTRFSQGTSIFSRLKHEREKPTRRRSLVSTTVFTRLGDKDKNVFVRLCEKRRSVHSRLGPEAVSRRRHANERRSGSTGRSGEDPNHRKKEARDLIRSYVTCSNERQREIEREWDAADHAKRAKHARTEETCLLENEHDRGGH